MASAKHPFQVVEETIRLTLAQLNENNPTRKDPNLGLNEFWDIFASTSSAVSHEATKLSLIISKPPIATREELKPYADNIEKTVLALLTAYVNFPPEYGFTIAKIIKQCVQNILRSLESLCSEAANSNSSLITIGNVWEQCNLVQNLPKDNKGAILQNLNEESGMVNDALMELKQSTEEEEGDGEWSAAEKQLLPFCLGLLKAAKATLKKTKTRINDLSETSSSCSVTNRLLDEMNEPICKCSSLVDEFVLSIYSPINHGLMKTNARNLMENLMSILGILKNMRELNPDCDYSWIDFLEKAIKHNYEKIDDLALED